MKTVLIFSAVLAALLLSLLPSLTFSQTLQFTDYTADFSVQVPVSGINAELESVVYYTDQLSSISVGVSLLPGSGANSYNFSLPSALTATALNNPSTCTPSAAIVLSSSVPQCNYTLSWSRQFGGLMTVTMQSLDEGGVWRDLSLSTIFILDTAASTAAASVTSAPRASATSAPVSPTSAPVSPTSAASTATSSRSSSSSSPAATSAPISVTSAPPAVTFSYPTASLCFISYSVPGSVDYPWSSATQLTVSYDPTAINLGSGLSAVQLMSGSGSRTFTNRFGASFTSSLTLASAGGNDNLLYVGSAIPVDSAGLAFTLSSPLQLPGSGPVTQFSTLTLLNSSGVVAEVGASRVDQTGQAWFASVPGFLNQTIGASDVNALAVSYATCQAPITFTNGLRSPTQPSVSNGASQFSFSYYISDGTSYTVAGNVSITASSAFANAKDQLGNPYQTVTAVSGTRLYTSLSDGSTLRSAITGLATGTAAASASQRFYPYSLLASAPGVYSTPNAPFLDGAGIAFTVSPAIPALGDSATSSTVYSTATLRLASPQHANAVLVDSVVHSTPSQALQQQLYVF